VLRLDVEGVNGDVPDLFEVPHEPPVSGARFHELRAEVEMRQQGLHDAQGVG